MKYRFLEMKKLLMQCISYFFVLFVSLLCLSCSDKDPLADNYPETRRLKYNIQLQNQLTWDIPKIRVNIYLPVYGSTYHHLLDYSLSGTYKGEYRLVKDGIGNNILSLQLEDVPRGYVSSINLDLKVGYSESALEYEAPVANEMEYTAKSEKMVYSDSALKHAEPVPNKMEYAAEGEEEIDLPEVEFQENDDFITKINRIFAATSPQEEPEEDSDNEISFVELVKLFAATGQLHGIPVRVVLGTILMDDNQQQNKSLKLWVEALDNQTWIKLDVQNQRPFEHPEEYLGLRIFDQLHELPDNELSNLLYSSQGLSLDIAIQ